VPAATLTLSTSPPAASPSLSAASAGREPTAVGRRLQIGIAIVALVAVAALWTAVGWVLQQRRDDALAAELRQNVNITLALEEQSVRVIAAVDQATLRLRNAVLAGDGQAPPAADLVRFANETGLVPDILAQLSYVGADGRFIGSNLDPDGSRTGHVDLSEREHIRAHTRPETVPADMRPQSPDGLFVGKPVLGKVSGKWTIQLTRRIARPDGRLVGVVVASVDPSYFERVYQRVQLGRQGSVGLVGLDGTMRARVVGGQSGGVGTEVDRQGMFATYTARPEGTLVARSSIDGRNRLVAFRRVGDYPLVQLVGTSTEEALAGWVDQRNLAVSLSLLLTAAVAAAALAMIIGLRRIDRTVAALRASEARAQAASLAKSEFIAAVSHELRTPLTSIRGFAEVMEDRLEDARFRRSASLIRKGAEHLNELLTEILDLAKVEAGAMQLRREPVELRPLLRGTTDFFMPPVTEKGLALELSIAEDVPTTLTCDALRLKQILNNLLSNAVKFTERGSVSLIVESIGPRVAFHVVDSGPGIPEALHELVFEKFRQADGNVSHEHGGTGLGLALARGLAELMDGQLLLQSVPGQGARFTLLLPAVEPRV
jgi:signal transduction histidine kinase